MKNQYYIFEIPNKNLYSFNIKDLQFGYNIIQNFIVNFKLFVKGIQNRVSML